jgi:hypothetical protein
MAMTGKGVEMRFTSKWLSWMGVACATAAVGCGDDPGEAGGEGTIKVQVSGEDAATEGFRFPMGSEVTIADGWEVVFDHVLVVIGAVSVAEDPDLVPSDQSMTGATVAELAGPFIVDLAQAGTEVGAGGEGVAVLLGRIEGQNLAGGAGFAGDQRYALSYSTVAASAGATLVNVAAAAQGHVETMVANGYSVMYVGTATFEGTSCESGDDAYFATFPTEVPLALGFASPARMINCQNQENQGEPFDGEELQRGVAIPTQGEALAQLTFHLEHAFYSDVEHEPALYFDQLAAGVVGQPAGTVLTLEHLVGVDPTALVDAAGAPLPWRVCDGSALPAGAQRGFEVGSVPVDPSGDPSQALRDYADYVRYVQSTQGHLNGGEGLCFIQRSYPSPP